MKYVVGVDGCRGGWIAVVFNPRANTLTPLVHKTFQELLGSYQDADAIGVDIPIGLGHGAPRAADLQARKLLGHRHSTVFPTPDIRIVEEFFHADAPVCRYPDVLSRTYEVTGRGIAQQAFNICAKIAEVNRAMSPELQSRIIEIHPEVSFRALAGRPMDLKKDRVAGFEERREALMMNLGWPIWTRKEALAVARPAKPDDLLDATVAAWSALRFAQGESLRVPAQPNFDPHGLRTEIVF